MSSCHPDRGPRDPAMLAGRFDQKPDPGSVEMARTASEPHTPLTTAKSAQVEPESPMSQVAGDSVVTAFGTESMKTSSDMPDRIDVVCGNLRGTFLVSKGKIIVDGHAECPKEVAPTEFERLGGRAATKKWKRSIRVVTEDGAAGKPVGDWLLSYGLDIRANTLMPAAEQSRGAPQYTEHEHMSYCHNSKQVKRARMSPVPEAYPPSPYSSPVRVGPCSGLAQRVEALVILGEYLNGRRHDIPLELLDISEPPLIGGLDLPLASLYNLVAEHGGYDVVTRNSLWQDVAYSLGLAHGNIMRVAYLLRSAYQRFLLRYERFQASWNEFLASTPPAAVHRLDMPAYDSSEDYYETPEDAGVYNNVFSRSGPSGYSDGVNAIPGSLHRARHFSHPSLLDPNNMRMLPDGHPSGVDNCQTMMRGDPLPMPFAPAACHGSGMTDNHARLSQNVRASPHMMSYASSPEILSAGRRYTDAEPGVKGVKPLSSFMSPGGPATPATLLSKPSAVPLSSPPSCGPSPICSQQSDMLDPLPQSSVVSSAAIMFEHSSLKSQGKSLHSSPDVPTGTATSYSSSSDQSQYYPHSPSSLTWDSPSLSSQRSLSNPPGTSGNIQAVHIHAYAGLPPHSHSLDPSQMQKLEELRGGNAPGITGMRLHSAGKGLPASKQLDPSMWPGMADDSDAPFPHSWQEQGSGVSSFCHSTPSMSHKRSADEAFHPSFSSRLGYSN